MKRVLSLFLALTISLSIVIIDNKTSYASTDNCINSSSYTGTYDGSKPNFIDTNDELIDAIKSYR